MIQKFTRLASSAIFFMLVVGSAASPTQAGPAQAYQESSNPSQIPANYGKPNAPLWQMHESNSQYYTSLRWLVYMLILSLPIVPDTILPPSFHIVTPDVRISPPKPTPAGKH